MSHFEFERKSAYGLNLYFQGWQADNGQKGVVSLVHGLGEHSGRYSTWASWLNQAGYSVVSYDLRGHGKSSGNRGHVSSFEDFLQDTDLLLEETMDRFPGLPSFIYGHSLGAIIVASYVLHRKPQVNGVVLSGLAVKTSLQEQKSKILLARIFGSIAPKFTMDSGLDPMTISRDPQIVDKYKNDPLVHYKASFGFGKSSLAEITWLEQHAGEWTVPILVMHGELDKLGYAEGSREFAAHIKGDCTLKIWQGLMHEVHNEPENEQVFEFVRQWLDRHLPA